MSKKKLDLVQIIRDNPNAVAIIDNDYWKLYRVHPDENPHEDDDESLSAWEEWDVKNTIASSDNSLKALGDGGYGSGNCYGGDILQALAVIVGLQVESV